jgi:long-chain acyl-CoA synthetase
MKNYPLNEAPLFENVRELVEYIGETYSEDTAYSFRIKPFDEEIQRMSYRRLSHDVRCLATELIARGFKGKHVAIIGKMSYGWACAYLAMLSVGVVAVPLDPEWTAEDLCDTVKKAECAALFCGTETYENKAEVIKAGSDIALTVVLDSDCIEENLSHLIMSGYDKRNGGDTSYEDAEIDAEALALLVFTSGTTGKGKGVMLSQKALLSNVHGALQLISASKKSISVLPPHHTFGSTITILGQLTLGIDIYITSGIKYIAKEVKELKPGHLVLVPLFVEAFYRKILSGAKSGGKEKQLNRMIKVMNGLNKAGIDLRRTVFKSVLANFGGELRTIVCGGAPLKQEIIDTFAALGITIINGYGITECAPLISCNRNKKTKDGSVGMPIEADEVKIADPDENGEGEICVKGPNVMLGYYKDEEATAAAFDEEGFFRTGDYGRLDEEGWIYITGRLKNLIILSNGKNVYPEEIEAELSEIEGIVDIVVYEGISKRGADNNAIVAEIYPDKAILEEKGIDNAYEYFKQKINDYNRTAVAYKKIGLVKIREEEFPKNTLRKITRFTLDKTID